MVTAASPTTGTARRVLVLRCCRADQFRAAVDWVRARVPGAEITALTAPSGVESAVQAGVAQVLVLDGRLGIRQLDLARWLLLRARRFDLAVIPQMTADPASYMNVHRLVSVLGARAVAVWAPYAPVRRWAAGAFARQAWLRSCASLLRACDVPVMLVAMIAARLVPRRRHRVPGRTRVLHIISELREGAAEAQLATLVTGLPRDRYEPEVLTLGAADEAFCRRHFDGTGVIVRQIEPGLSRVAAMAAIRGLCRDRQYDIVHTWHSLATIVGTAGARLAGTPRVVSGVQHPPAWDPDRRNRQVWRRPAATLAARLADLVVSTTRALDQAYAHWAIVPAGRRAVVHVGLDPASLAFDTGACRDALRILLGIGREWLVVGTSDALAPPNEVGTFLHAVRALGGTCPDLVAVVLGDGPARAHLEAMARDLGIAGRVHFLGARRDRLQLLAGLDLVVCCATDGGFPTTLVEAALLDVPVVAPDLGACRELLGDRADLAPVADARTVATLVHASLTNAAVRRATAATLHRRATVDFSAAQMVAAWIQAYALGTPPAAATRDDVRAA